MSSGAKEPAAGDPEAAQTIVSHNPATLAVNDEIPEASPEEVDRAVADAEAAQVRWAERSVEERIEVLATVRDLLLARKREIARTVSKETGKPLGEAIGAEIAPVLSAINHAVDEGPTLLEEPIPLGTLASTGESTVVREPLGVAGLITPWNYPFGVPATQIVPMLLAGNAVLLKPAEETTLTALDLEDLLDDAGVPDGVFTVLPGRGPVTGQALADADIDHLSFTGSASVGFQLQEACARRGVPTCLELGGSDPAVVLADANVDLTADGIVWARYTNAGQSCAAVKRVYAEDSIEPDLRAAIVERVEALRIGYGEDEPVDVGPLISADAVDEIHGQVQRSVEMGAEVLTGGEPIDDLDGHFYAPTVLGGVTQDMPVVTEETFGPVLPIMPVADADEAVARANDTRFGLTASVWTRDTDRGERLARRIEAGTVTVNEHLYTFGLAATPWGGYKDSGGDLAHGRWGIESVTRPKHIHVAGAETFPRGGRFTDLWWFPYHEGFADLMAGTLDVLYGSSLATRVAKAPAVVRMALRNGDR